MPEDNSVGKMEGVQKIVLFCLARRDSAVRLFSGLSDSPPIKGSLAFPGYAKVATGSLQDVI